VVLTLIAVAGVAVWQVGRSHGAADAIAIAVTATAALFAGIATWAYSSQHTSAATGRRLIALGCWVWVLGRVLQLDSLVGTGRDGIHTVSTNAGFLGMMPLVIAGLVYLRPPQAARRNDHKLLLDLVIGFATVIAVGWAWAIRPTVHRDAVIPADKALIAAHAFGDGLLVLTLLVVLIRVGNRPLPASLGLTAAGVSLLVLADLLWISSRAETGHRWSAFEAPAWVAGFLLLGIGAAWDRLVAPAASLTQGEVDPDREPFWRVAVLYCLAFLLLVLIAVEEASGNGGNGELVVVVGSLAILALVLLRLGLTLGESRRTAGRLIHQVDRDPLTGLINYRKVHQRLDQELIDGRAHGRSVAVALLDIDDFKAINDTCGHQAGDRVLRAFADILRRTSRGTDVAARYGGDEFMLILPGLELKDARKVAQRLLDEIAHQRARLTPEPCETVGVSIGLAVTRGGRRSAKQLVAFADAAMYDAKARGKNRVVIVDADRVLTMLEGRTEQRGELLSRT
jgi:diguanylate cyclase (GGDEF)-like protein